MKLNYRRATRQKRQTDPNKEQEKTNTTAPSVSKETFKNSERKEKNPRKPKQIMVIKKGGNRRASVHAQVTRSFWSLIVQNKDEAKALST